MKISERIFQHLESKKAELNELLDKAIESMNGSGWREETVPKAIELQKEIDAAETLFIACMKKETAQ